MIKKLLITLTLLALPEIVLAQTHNTLFAKGLGGSQCLGVRNNSAAATLNNTDQAWGAIAVDSAGQVFTTTSGGLTSATRTEDAGSAGSDFLTPAGAIRVDQVQPGAQTSTDFDWSTLFVNNDGGLYTQNIAGRSGGCTQFGLLSAASNNSTNIRTTYGSLYHVVACNTNAAIRYVKFYNKSSAPSPASDNGLLMARFMIPGTSCLNVAYAVPMYFNSGIGYATVTGVSDTDNTSVGANDILLTGCYK